MTDVKVAALPLSVGAHVSCGGVAITFNLLHIGTLALQPCMCSASEIVMKHVGSNAPCTQASSQSVFFPYSSLQLKYVGYMVNAGASSD